VPVLGSACFIALNLSNPHPNQIRKALLLKACGFSAIPITRFPLKPINDSPPIPISVLP
jgi:hypothetical protein